jgi:hypothetical protein
MAWASMAHCNVLALENLNHRIFLHRPLLITHLLIWYHSYHWIRWHLHTFPSRCIPKGVEEASRISLSDAHVLQNCLAMRYTTDVTCGKPIAVWSQSISGVSAINPFVAFYDIHGRKREVLFFYSVPDTTRDDLDV